MRRYTHFPTLPLLLSKNRIFLFRESLLGGLVNLEVLRHAAPEQGPYFMGNEGWADCREPLKYGIEVDEVKID